MMIRLLIWINRLPWSNSLLPILRLPFSSFFKVYL
ncbi:hypothetical protein F383_33471 [Gossypium arboreum]|uniref:Uncharacterized protein n=1 Tax=Gossypium arboreum TaxID=29729 RepID=A0A0B0N301_GOSAR|nr:hypothetical protein F383_33471 [Gossypium arboreum]